MASSLAHEGCSKPDLQHDLTFLILTSLQAADTDRHSHAIDENG
jgi:hypothetical protein